MPSPAVPSRRPTGGPLRNLPVSQKLFGSFGVLFLLVIAVGGLGLYDLDQSGRRLDRVYQHNLPSSALLGEIRADVQQATSLSARLILRSSITDVSSVQTTIKALDTEIDRLWAEY